MSDINSVTYNGCFPYTSATVLTSPAAGFIVSAAQTVTLVDPQGTSNPIPVLASVIYPIAFTKLTATGTITGLRSLPYKGTA